MSNYNWNSICSYIKYIQAEPKQLKEYTHVQLMSLCYNLCKCVEELKEGLEKKNEQT